MVDVKELRDFEPSGPGGTLNDMDRAFLQTAADEIESLRKQIAEKDAIVAEATAAIDAMRRVPTADLSRQLAEAKRELANAKALARVRSDAVTVANLKLSSVTRERDEIIRLAEQEYRQACIGWSYTNAPSLKLAQRMRYIDKATKLFVSKLFPQCERIDGDGGRTAVGCDPRPVTDSRPTEGEAGSTLSNSGDVAEALAIAMADGLADLTAASTPPSTSPAGEADNTRIAELNEKYGMALGFATEWRQKYERAKAQRDAAIERAERAEALLSQIIAPLRAKVLADMEKELEKWPK